MKLPQLKFILLFSIIFLGSFLVAGKALGADKVCYVDASIGSSGDGLTPETAKKTINECVTLINANAVVTGHKIYVKSGTYTDYPLLNNANSANITILGLTDLTDTNSIAPEDSVVINVQTGNHGIYFNQANQTLKGFTIKNAPTGRYNVYANNAANLTLQQCWFKTPTGDRNVYLISSTGVSITNCVFSGVRSKVPHLQFDTTSGGTIAYSSFGPSAQYPGSYIYIHGTGTININNSEIFGSYYLAINQDAAAVTTVTNSKIWGNIVTTYNLPMPSGYNVIKKTAGTLTVRNSLINGPGLDDTNMFSSGITVDNPDANIYSHLPKNSIPWFNKSFLVLAMDDVLSDNLTKIENYASLIASYGGKATFFLPSTVKSVSNYQSRLQALIAAGHAVESHSYSHTDLDATVAFQIKYNGTDTNSTITITGGDSSGSIVLATTEGNDNYTYNFSSTNSLQAFIANSGGKVTLLGSGKWIVSRLAADETGAGVNDAEGNLITTTQYLLGTSLASLAQTAVPTLTPTLAINLNVSAYNTGFYKDELGDWKDELSTITGATVTTIATPRAITMADAVYTKITQAGFVGVRAEYSPFNGSYIDLREFKANRINSFMGWSLIADASVAEGPPSNGTSATVRGKAIDLASYMIDNPSIVVMFWHGIDDANLTSAQLGYFLNEIQTAGIEIVTFPYAMAWLRNPANGWTAGGSEYYSNLNLPLGNNYPRSDFPSIDSGTDVSLTSDYSGNSIYGTPDIGAYEYQPPYTFAANNIPTTGSVRLYSDGKYRMLTATTTTATGTFSVKPSTGSYLSTTTQYMDITVDSWLTSGTKNKQWTATSTAGNFLTQATSTLYTIGDLAASTYYTFKLDGVASSTAITGYGSTSCTNGVCLSDSSGQIQFVYSGGYSSHTFGLEQDTSSPTNVDVLSITANSTSQITVVAQTATDADPGLHSTPYQFQETTGHTGGSSSSYQAETSFADSGLSSNTQYTYQVKAKDGNSNESSYSTATSTYTLAPTPTNLAGTAGQTTMALTVDSFTNATADSSGYYFSRTGANSGWIQTNSWSDSGLACGTSYDYTVKYRNGDGTETGTASLTKSTSACPGGGMPSEWYNPPKAPTGGFGVSVVNPLTGLAGLQTTNSSIVILNLKTGSDTTRMAISNSPDFKNSGLENYATSKIWNVCWTNSMLQTPVICPDGTYIVYVKYYTSWGTASDVVTTTINLKTGSANSTSSPTPIIPTTPAAVFTKDLNLGQKDSQIKALQQFLNQNGFKLVNSGGGSPNNETDYFGKLTQSALIKFQSANKLGEKGFLGTKTREFINSMTNTGSSTEKPAEPVNNNQTVNSSTENQSFTKDLKLGQTDADVKRLQIFLNSDSDTKLANSSVGSFGKETNFFGTLTKNAVIKFQEKYASEILTPLGLKKGTGIVSKNTRAKINELMVNK